MGAPVELDICETALETWTTCADAHLNVCNALNNTEYGLEALSSRGGGCPTGCAT